jgi:hypothetical protein
MRGISPSAQDKWIKKVTPAVAPAELAPVEASLRTPSLPEGEPLPGPSLVEHEERIWLRDIANEVATQTKVGIRWLLSESREGDVVRARNLAFLRSYRQNFSISQISRFYKKNHVTVRHGIARAVGMPPLARHTSRAALVTSYLRKARGAE